MAEQDSNCDLALKRIKSLRTEIRDKFQTLHIALDERESELMYRLDENRGTIITAWKQWESRVKDATHTIAHGYTGLGTNKWSSQLETDAREDLLFLEKNKPAFQIGLSLMNGFEEKIANFAKINMKQTNKQTNMRPEIESIPTYDRNIFDIMQKGVSECPILQSDYLSDYYTSRRLIGDEIKGVKGFKHGKKPSSDTYNEMTLPNKMNRSVSLSELNTMKYNKGTKTLPKGNKTAFDDSYIKKDKIVKPIPKPFELSETIEVAPKVLMPRGFVWNRGARKNPNRNANNREKCFSVCVPPSYSSATYKLTEVTIGNYLAERVTVNLRTKKDKQVKGTLRCIVNTNSKVPIVGVELDTKDGECDGCFGNTRYFKTKANKACFTSADCVCITISMDK